MNKQYTDYGSIEGQIVKIGNKFFLKERLNGDMIEVSFTKRRTEYYGEITYDKNGNAISICIDSIYTFPPDENIPSFREISGILK